jgi:hypothetical protein
VKDNRKSQKKKILHTLMDAQDRYRAKELFVTTGKHDLKLFD